MQLRRLNEKPLRSCFVRGRKEAGRDGATNASPALEHSEPDKEVRHMSRCREYSDSTRSRKRQEVS